MANIPMIVPIIGPVRDLPDFGWSLLGADVAVDVPRDVVPVAVYDEADVF